jgi:hypothetical protein
MRSWQQAYQQFEHAGWLWACAYWVADGVMLCEPLQRRALNQQKLQYTAMQYGTSHYSKRRVQDHSHQWQSY